MKKIISSVIFCYIAFSFCGCALTDYKINLSYKKIGEFSGGSCEIHIAKPVIDKTVPMKDNFISLGRTLLAGNPNAQLLIGNDVSDLLSDALSNELKDAGFKIVQTQTLPKDALNGIEILITNIFSGIEMAATMTSNKAISVINLKVKAVKNGKVIKTFFIEGKGDHLYSFGMPPKMRTIALEKGFQECMKNLLPQLITLYK